MVAGSQPLSDMTVLVVEDSWQLAEVMQRALERAGARVVGPAGTLAEAERLAAGSAIDAAVMDLDLGGRPADPLAERLADAGVKVVLLTAYARPSALAEKVHAYLSKPAKPQDLIAALQKPLHR